ncbi:6-phosphogluconolactonase [Paenibacillus sp. CC-CFT747]|nr:6-phosphogluconolactonase [Paenibacillus sp. CC-CFT747]
MVHIHILPLELIGRFVVDRLAEQVKNKPHAVLGMTTGNTPLTAGIYKELVRRENNGEIDLSQAVLINPDEQLGIPKEHPESYYTYMRKHLLDHLRQPASRWHIPDGASEDPEAECDLMEKTIRESGGIDWQLMGIGLNGHICFIEPQPAIPATCYVTPIAESNRQLYAPYFGGLWKRYRPMPLPLAWEPCFNRVPSALWHLAKAKPLSWPRPCLARFRPGFRQPFCSCTGERMSSWTQRQPQT